jgi:hypothetical protein
MNYINAFLCVIKIKTYFLSPSCIFRALKCPITMSIIAWLSLTENIYLSSMTPG